MLAGGLHDTVTWAFPGSANAEVGAPGGTGAGGVGGVGGAGAAAIVIVIGVDVVPVELAAVTVKENVPAVVGVPVRTPVVGSRVSPGGSAPVPTPKVMALEGELVAWNVYAT